MSDKDTKLIELARKRFKESLDAWEESRLAYAEDLRFVSGEQWHQGIQRERDLEGRPCLTINRLPQFIRQVTNEQRQNKPSIKIRPVDDIADPETADMLQGLIRHIEANSNADLAYDNGTYNSVSGGFGFWRIVTDYLPKSFDQEAYIVAIENPLTVFPDADSKALDGSDWKYCFITDDIPRDDFEAEYGKDMPAGWDAADGLDCGLSEVTRQSVRVAEYFVIEKIADKLCRLADGSVVYKSEIQGDAAIVDERDCDRKKVMWYKLAANKILDRREVAGEYIPVVVCYGDMINVDGKRKLVSLIRYGKDSQRMLNYYRSSEAEIMALQPKAPFVVAEGQIEGYEDVWASANNVNYSYLPYKPNTVGGVVVPPPQRIQSAMLPSGLQAMSEIAEKDLMNTVGIHEAGLGMKSNETSGAAIMARQREGDVATYHFIDNVTRAIRHTGKILLSMIPVIYDTQRVIRILGEDESESYVEMNKPVLDGQGKEIARLFDPSVGQYDVVCTAGPSYTSRRQESVQAMMQILPQAPQLMQGAGDLLIKAMDWPGAEEIAERLVKMMPPELRPEKESDPDDEEEGEGDQLPPEVQAALQEKDAMLQQMDQAIQQMQAELESKQATEQAAMMKVQIEAQKVEIDRFKAETDRLKAEADIATKMQAPELSEAEKMSYEAQLQVQLQEMKEEHEVEMALLNAKLQAAAQPEEPENEAAIIDRDQDGRPTAINGRMVMRDDEGNIIGLG